MSYKSTGHSYPQTNTNNLGIVIDDVHASATGVSTEVVSSTQRAANVPLTDYGQDDNADELRIPK